MNLIQKFSSAIIGYFLYTREKLNHEYFENDIFEKLEIKNLLIDKIPGKLSTSILNFQKRIKFEEVIYFSMFNSQYY